MDKVNAKCFQSMTMEMKINLGLKYSLVSLISNSICLHSTRIYVPFQTDKNLILCYKALQIKFQGKKPQHSPVISGAPQLQTSTKRTGKPVTIKAELTCDLWIEWHQQAAIIKININSTHFCFENKAMKFPHTHLPKGHNSDQLCQRRFLKSFYRQVMDSKTERALNVQ